MRALVAVNADTDPLGVLEEGLRDAGVELALWDVQHERAPDDPADFDAVIALGGATHPDEDDACPWLAGERELLRTAVERELPTLGVCLGAELLAQALGAPVYRLPEARLGWFALRAAPDAGADPLGRAWPLLDEVIEWHSYGFPLPRGAALLAGRRDAVQAFRFGRRAWGFQYHLEADADILREWTLACPEDLAAAGVSGPDLLARAASRGSAVTAHGRAVGAAFGRVVAEAKRAAPDRAGHEGDRRAARLG